MEYSIKVRAYSSAGMGPFSAEFKGRTLKSRADGKYPVFLWSAHDGLLKTDILGDNVEILVHKEAMQDNGENHHIIDVTWYRDVLYLVLNNSQVLRFNTTSRKLKKMNDIDSAGSIAVDWIGQKLYWSSPKHQLITRANLNGSYQEPLPIITVARELNIDAINAHIYWSTGHSIECARLNGAEHIVYYQAGLFSGKQVMGLTLDLQQTNLYWMVRSFEESVLFRAKSVAKSARYQDEIEAVGDLEHAVLQGPLRCYGNQLVWLQDEDVVIVADMNGKNAAVLSRMGLSDLKTVAVVDHQSRKYPDGKSECEVHVIPNYIRPESLAVQGTWKAFNITWEAVSNVNYGTVFYEIKIDSDIIQQSLITENNVFVVSNTANGSPYSLMNIALRAFTYWGSSHRTVAQLRSPTGLPSVVQNPRVFVTSSKDNPVNETKVISSEFRWDIPAKPNGIIRGYKINHCQKRGDSLHIQCESAQVPGGQLYFKRHNLELSNTYYFQVQAFTDGGIGPWSVNVTAKTGDEMPVPKLLLATQDTMTVTDIDSRNNHTVSSTAVPPVDMAVITFEKRFFWLSQRHEIMAGELDSSKNSRIFIMNGTAYSMTVDWVSRHVYWAEKHEDGYLYTINRLDLNQDAAKRQPETLYNTIHPIHSIGVDPFSSQLFWTSGNEIGELMSCKTDGTSSGRFFGNRSRHKRSSSSRRASRRDCNCPDRPPFVERTFALDHTDPLDPKLLWVDGWQNHVYTSTVDGCRCDIAVNATSHFQVGLPPSSMTADHSHIYWSNSSEDKVYFVAKKPNETVRLSDGINSLHVRGIRKITALGDTLQPYPEIRCLIPKQEQMRVFMKSRRPKSIDIILPEPLRHAGCEHITLASPKYTVYYGLVGPERDSGCSEVNLHFCKNTTTYEKTHTIRGLEAFSHYCFFISISNYYSDMKGIKPVVGHPTLLQTDQGAPFRPRNLTVTSVSPNTIRLSWLPPVRLNGHSVWYEIHWSTSTGVPNNGQFKPRDTRASTTEWTVNIDSLFPDCEYDIKVRCYSENGHYYNETKEVSIRTLPEPNNIKFVECSSSTINVSWIAGVDYITSYTLQYSRSFYNMWTDATLVKAATSPGEPNFFQIKSAKPKTQYVFRLNITYTYSSEYIWPKDHRFVFETLGDRPGAPGTPVLRNDQKKGFLEITWVPSEENGGKIQQYVFERKLLTPVMIETDADGGDPADKLEPTPIAEWKVIYNGSDNRWIVSGLDSANKYVFRVRAKNEYGWSDQSEVSQEFDFTASALSRDDQPWGIVLAVAVPTILIILCFVVFGTITMVRKRDQDKKNLQITANNALPRPDLELATLRELPQHSSFVHQNNALYTAADIAADEEIAALPFVRRDQITLTKFLGSGAFGEVFEGVARNLAGFIEPSARVAIKTLRKGANEQEKIEFLKEAQLMSNFKHEHIIRLLGVCLDNDPIFILLELMEGGDLLSYLRNNRPNQLDPNKLTLGDLIDICVDVSKGCCYLEEMHFVHRDLACRNCLVSSTDRANRIVKIGDFGLARDIYKNDYYRKEGEGLLPVRWMSPESLVDGVFTCQSDIWAFGVLLWEIMTLGQQPYPARTNLEVLHYVRNGGRLTKPNNCPDDLHKLMLECWSYTPDGRPTFKYCQETLVQLKEKCVNLPVTTVHNGQYVGHVMDGSSWKTSCSKDGAPFLLEQQQQLLRNRLVSDDGAGSSSSDSRGNVTTPNTLTLTPNSGCDTGLGSSDQWTVPPYLELLSDSAAEQQQQQQLQQQATPTVSLDGYEIPRVMDRSPANSSGLVSDLIVNYAELSSGERSATPSLSLSDRGGGASVGGGGGCGGGGGGGGGECVSTLSADGEYLRPIQRHERDAADLYSECEPADAAVLLHINKDGRSTVYA